MANVSASAPHPSLFQGFHTGGGGWVIMETAEEMTKSALRGFSTSLLLALVVALVVTRSARVSCAATCCIGASSLGFAALQGAMGWPFGVIESVCALASVGPRL